MKLFKRNNKDCTYEPIIAKKKEIVQPKVYILSEVLKKMKLYVDEADEEIGWLGFCKKENDYYVIYDTELIKQEISATTTELDEEAIAQLGTKLATENPEKFNDLRVWGHSHVNMQVFGSGTDEETFEQFYQDCDYFIRIICNKKEDILVDFVDTDNEIRYNNIEWTALYTNEEKAIMDELEKIEARYDELTEAKDKIDKKFIEENKETVKKQIKELCNKKTYVQTWKNKKWNTKQPASTVTIQASNNKKVSTLVPFYDNKGKKINNVLIEDIMNDADLSWLVETQAEDWTVEELKEIYKDDYEFEFYKEEDWKALKTAIEELVEQVKEEETDELYYIEDKKDTDYGYYGTYGSYYDWY